MLNYQFLRNIHRFHQFRLISSSKSNSDVNITKFQAEQLNRYYVPKIDEAVLQKINIIVGIQVGLNYVSWAKIDTKQNLLTGLNCFTLPNMTKMELHQIYSCAYETVNNLPTADYYIMENLSNIVVGTGGKTKLRLHATRIQFVAMVVAMINQKRSDTGLQSVFFMKSQISAKLFGLLIGSEIVSNVQVVSRLLYNDGPKPFPTNIKCEIETLSDYENAENVQKEMLGQAVLLTLASAELMYHKNSNCFKILSNFKIPK